jgi:hypothetical protein
LQQDIKKLEEKLAVPLNDAVFQFWKDMFDISGLPDSTSVEYAKIFQENHLNDNNIFEIKEGSVFKLLKMRNLIEILEELKDLGIKSLGHRKILWKAILGKLF